MHHTFVCNHNTDNDNLLTVSQMSTQLSVAYLYLRPTSAQPVSISRAMS